MIINTQFALAALLVYLTLGMAAPPRNRFSISQLSVDEIVDEMVLISQEPKDWTGSLEIWERLGRALFGRVLSGMKLREVAMRSRSSFLGNKRNLKTAFCERVAGGRIFIPDAASTPIRGGAERHCRCGQPSNPDEPMVLCNKCNRWYHLDCEQMEQQDLGRQYSCRACRGHTARTRPQTPSIVREESEVQPEIVSEMPSSIGTESMQADAAASPIGYASNELDGFSNNVNTSYNPCWMDQLMQNLTAFVNQPELPEICFQSRQASPSMSPTFEQSEPDHKEPFKSSSSSSDSTSSSPARSSSPSSASSAHSESSSSASSNSSSPSSPGASPQGETSTETHGPAEFEIEVVPSEWKDFWDADKKNTLFRVWTELVVEKIRRATGNRACVLQNKERKLRKSGNAGLETYQFRAVFRCMHNGYNCFQYTLNGRWTNPGVRFAVRRTGTFCHQPMEQFAREVKGQKRKAFAQAMADKTASTFASELHASAALDEIATGNAETLPSRRILRDIRREQLATGDYAADPYDDIRKMRQDEQAHGFSFIRDIASAEMMVVAFYDAQILLLKALRSMGPVIAHVDATGKIVQPFEKSSKRVYLYALAVTSPEPGQPPLALMEFATSEHTVNRLQFCFRSFSDRCRTLLNLQRGEEIFPRVEIDFSQALLLAVLYVFCGKYTVDDYFKRCWKHLMGKREPPVTLVHGCESHCIKMLLNQFRTKLPSTTAFENLQQFIYSFVYSAKIGSVYRRVRLLFLLLQSRTNHRMIQPWLAQLKAPTSENYHEENRQSWESFHFNRVHPNRIYTNTHFGQFFNDLARECMTEVQRFEDETQGPNEYACPALLNYLLEDVLPYTPILTRIMFPGAADEGHEANQWAIEHWWRIIKIEELLARSIRLAMKAGRYFRQAREFLAGRIKEFAAGLMRVLSLRIANAGLGAPLRRGRARGRGKAATLRYLNQATGAVPDVGNFKRDMRSINEELDVSVNLLKKRRGTADGDIPFKRRKSSGRRSQNKHKEQSHNQQEFWHRGGSQIPNRPRVNPYVEHDIRRIAWARREQDDSGFFFENTCPIDNILNDLCILFKTNARVARWLRMFPVIAEILQDVLNSRVNAARAAWLRLSGINPTPGMDIEGDPNLREGVPLRRITGNYRTRVICPLHGEVRRVDRNIHDHQRTTVENCLDAINTGLDVRTERCTVDECQAPTTLLHDQTDTETPAILNFPLAGPGYAVQPDPPEFVTWFGRRYQLFSRRIDAGRHFTSNFNLHGNWWLYDGITSTTPPGYVRGVKLVSALYVLID